MFVFFFILYNRDYKNKNARHTKHNLQMHRYTDRYKKIYYLSKQNDLNSHSYLIIKITSPAP